MFRFDLFLRHLADRQRTPATIREYRYALDRLSRFLSSRGVEDDRNVARRDIEAFVASLVRTSGEQHAAKVAVSLRAYFVFLAERGVLFSSPVADWHVHRLNVTHYPVVPQGTLAEMLDAIDGDDPISVRGRAILEVAYSSALRPREIYSLKLSHVDRRRGVLFIEQSKGRKDRLVPVGRRALAWIDRYVTEVRPRYVREAGSEYVFVSHKNGRQLTKKGLRWAIQEALRRAGCDPIKPYSLRGSAATALLEAGMDVSYIQRLLGHVDVKTTVTYLRIGQKALAPRVAAVHPRRRWEPDEKYKIKRRTA